MLYGAAAATAGGSERGVKWVGGRPGDTTSTVRPFVIFLQPGWK